MDETATERLNNLLLENNHELLQPSSAQHTEFLRLAKYYLDPLAEDITEAQLNSGKQLQQSRKRKRKINDDGRDQKALLRMRKIHVDGLSVEQVWQQAKRILEAAAEEVEKSLPQADGLDESVGEDKVKANGTKKVGKTVKFLDDGLEIGESDEDETTGEEENEDLEENKKGDLQLDLPRRDKVAESDENSSQLDEDTPLSDFSEEEDGQKPQKTYVKDPNGLNDGFFSIDDFNKSTQFLENQDARGDPNDGAASDEEDIDWDADPLSMPLPANVTKGAKSGRIESQTRNQRHREDVDDESEDEDDGPTFGNMDLNAPEGDSDSDAEGEEDGFTGANGLGNTNEIFYADFFAPPAKKAGKNKPSKSRRDAKAYSSSSRVGTNDASALEKEPLSSEDENEEVQRAMSAVQRDLFEDEEEYDEDGDDMSGGEGAQARGNLSTHERRQLAFREEIRRLEAENVAAKPWSMTGETVAPVRPMNSLLEEDLDFERAGKPVPVITEDISESIEELIKKRILAREFDEVVRRRGGLGDVTIRRGRTLDEVSDSKPSKGLAEEYEQDHLRRTDPNYVDARSEALKATHKAIEAQWADISAQLDALCNYHFKPRPPAVSLDIRVDAPTISIEEARPGGTAATAGAAMLAPQEVYRPGDEKAVPGQVRTTGGAVMSKEEMSRENKQRRRRREKERAKKKQGALPAAKGAAITKKEREKEVVGRLKKGGVKVIDKKSGRLRNVDGSLHSDKTSASATGGSFKL